MGWSLAGRALWQSWNGPAVWALAVVALRPRALLRPSECVLNISHVDAAALRARGIRAVVLDKDNTVTAPYADEVHPDAAAGLARMRAAFPGPRGVVILSNSAGTPDDEGHADAARIEDRLGLPVIRHARKKPDCLDDVLAFLNYTSDGDNGGGGGGGVRRESSPVSERRRGGKADIGDVSGDDGGAVITAAQVAMVGDRLLTDIVFGNMHGMYTVHCQPLSTANDNPAARLIRCGGEPNTCLLRAARRGVDYFLFFLFWSQLVFPPLSRGWLMTCWRLG